MLCGTREFGIYLSCRVRASFRVMLLLGMLSAWTAWMNAEIHAQHAQHVQHAQHAQHTQHAQHAQEWQHWYHLPLREPPRIIKQTDGARTSPGSMLVPARELKVEPDTVTKAVERVRRSFTATDSAVVFPDDEEDDYEGQLRVMLQCLAEAAIENFLQNATISLDLPPERPPD